MQPSANHLVQRTFDIYKKKQWLLLFAILNVLPLSAQEQFSEDFETNLSAWTITNNRSVTRVNSNDPDHNFVMCLKPDGNISALIKDSEHWGSMRIEGELFFPDSTDSYLGFIYNYRKNKSREDFGLLYLKGNGSYIRANPWRDGNVSRLLYEEYKTNLRGNQSIQIRKWHRFKMEVVENECHLYIGNMSIPKITFNLFEHNSGSVGFQPRVVGGEVWIDNIKVSSIPRLSYRGKDIPDIHYQPEKLIVQWEVIGPFRKPHAKIERSFWGDTIVVDGKIWSWEPFDVDARGAVVTGKVTQYEGAHTVAYFRTFLDSDEDKSVQVHFSSTDELALYVNGWDYGRVYRDGYLWTDNDWNAWYDFWKNPKHAGSVEEIPLLKGRNQIVIRVRNGQFASGGFFAHLKE